MAYLDYDGLVRYNNKVNTKLGNKANVDGAYESMTVGNAEQLVSTVGENNKTPYNFRTSGGTIDIGDREVDKLVGGTVALNQQIKSPSENGTFGKQYAGTITYDGDTIINTATSNTQIDVKNSINVLFEKSHKYFCGADVMLSSSNTIKLYLEFNLKKITSALTPNVWNGVYTITTWNGDNKNTYMDIVTGSSVVIDDTLKVKNFMVIDLTKMFGSTIADYIYSLEQATAGAGVAWFRKLFPNDYYAYNAGQLMSVKTSSHDMVGFNAYDNSTGKAKLVGGMEYQITGTYTSISYSTGETLTPDSNGKFTPTSDGELTVSGGNATDTCVHLVWDGERDGEFEAYVKHSYALDPDLELRGIPKLDANDQLYYDGDTYESDGTVTRRYGVYTITGDEVFAATTHEQYILSASNNIYQTLKKPKNNGIIANLICDFAETKSYSQINVDGENISGIGVGANYLIIGSKEYSNWSNLVGKTIIYEVSTPTTESADPFQNPQIVDDFGTEEYVDIRDVAIPVGHDTMYQANLRAKLEMMPNLPETNGDYMLRKSASGAEYVAHTSPLPALPSEDGTYVLTCTVADGQATLSWGVQS